MITLDEMFQVIDNNEPVEIWVLDDSSEFHDFELPLPLHQYKVKSFYSVINHCSGYSCTNINVTIIK